mmetsp:Transcript_66758/g.198662  ORF Transcript_66758/g.198662 Transcript_66758/m.198662 type:complete len:297 (-) Transcript_66758:555-1445(-)
MQLEQLGTALLDDGEVLHHVGLGDAVAAAAREVLGRAAEPPEDGLDARADVAEGLLRLVVLDLVADGLAVDIVPLLLQGLQNLSLLGVLFAAAAAAEHHILLLVLSNLLLELLNVRAELIVVVEEGEVCVLGVDEILDEFVDIADSSRSLNPCKGLFIAGNLLLVRRDGHERIRRIPTVASNLLLELVLVFRERVLGLIVLGLQLRLHELLHAFVVLDQLPQLLPFLFELGMFLVSLLLQRCHLGLRGVPCLVGGVGLVNDVCHFVLLLQQLIIEFPVDVVKHDPLASKRVDLLAK